VWQSLVHGSYMDSVVTVAGDWFQVEGIAAAACSLIAASIASVVKLYRIRLVSYGAIIEIAVVSAVRLPVGVSTMAHVAVVSLRGNAASPEEAVSNLFASGQDSSKRGWIDGSIDE